MSVFFLKRPGLPDIAYQYQAGIEGLPALVFLPGFRSDMEGTKAVFLARHAAQKGQGCLRLDYSGHGASGGKFEEGTIGTWLSDALAVIDLITPGKIILVGSSMGGWIGLLAAIARKDKITAFVGLAAAPDFTRIVKEQMSESQWKKLKRDGYFSVENEYTSEPTIFTNALLEDGETHCLLDKQIPIDRPVRLIQGMKDTEVPWQTAHRISNALHTNDKKVILREHGDHRLSSDDDLKLLASVVDEFN